MCQLFTKYCALFLSNSVFGRQANRVQMHNFLQTLCILPVMEGIEVLLSLKNSLHRFTWLFDYSRTTRWAWFRLAWRPFFRFGPSSRQEERHHRLFNRFRRRVMHWQGT